MENLSNNKLPNVLQLIKQVIHILNKLGIPCDLLSARRQERMAMAFLAVADVNSPEKWSETRQWDGTRALKSRDIIKYINEHFQENISPGSYDDIRRKDLIFLVTADVIQKSAENPNAARNDPTRAYALTPEYAAIIRKFGSSTWDMDVQKFMAGRQPLSEKLVTARDIKKVPVILPSGTKIEFSNGEHNELQKDIIESFLPRYGFGAAILYVGDAADKFLVHDEAKLKQIGFFEISHGELPDVVAYSEQKNWLYLIEAVHSFGPMSQLRVTGLKSLLCNCKAELIFVTAFHDRKTFRKFAPDIAWETEVWIAEAPDHLIHFNGDKFLGPHADKHDEEKR